MLTEAFICLPRLAMKREPRNSSGNVIVIMTKQFAPSWRLTCTETKQWYGYLAVIHHILRNSPALNYEKAYFQNKNSHVVIFFFFCFMHLFLEINLQKINAWGARRVCLPMYFISDLIARILFKPFHSWVYSGSCGMNLIWYNSGTNVLYEAHLELW